jgi:hypothetical protein
MMFCSQAAPSSTKQALVSARDPRTGQFSKPAAARPCAIKGLPNEATYGWGLGLGNVKTKSKDKKGVEGLGVETLPTLIVCTHEVRRRI